MGDYLKSYDVMGANLRTSIDELRNLIDHLSETKADAYAFSREVEEKTRQIDVL